MKQKFLTIIALLCTVVIGGWALTEGETNGFWNDETNRSTSWGANYWEASEFTISTAEELAQFAQMVNNGNDFGGRTVILTADIDLSNHEWTPIGYWASDGGKTFKGTFNGNGKTISGLTIDETDGSQKGLFGQVDYVGTVKSVHLANSSIKAGSFVGGIVAYNYGTVTDCVVDEDVTVEDNGTGQQLDVFGGIVGYNRGSIIGCVSKAHLGRANGNQWGGIAGVNTKISNNDNPKIADCLFCGSMNISDNGTVGAIVGNNYAGSTLAHNFYYGCTIPNDGNTTGIGVGTSNGPEDVEDGASIVYTVTTDPEAIPHAKVAFNIINENEPREYETAGIAVTDHSVMTSDKIFRAVSGKNVEFPQISSQGLYNYTGWGVKDNVAELIHVPYQGIYAFGMPAQDVVVTATETEIDIHDPQLAMDGEGTASYPYHILNLSHLLKVKELVENSETGAIYFELGNDIYCGDYDFSNNAIGTEEHPFTGVFDGKGFIIDGLNANNGTSGHGLFGVIGEGGIVKNLTMTNASITATTNSGVIAWKNNGGTIENCHVDKTCTITIYGNSNVSCTDIGGIAGYSKGSIKGCTSAVSFQEENNPTYAAQYPVGGIVGHYSGDNSVENCLLFSSDDQLLGKLHTIGPRNSVVSVNNSYRVTATTAIEDQYVYTARIIQFEEGLSVVGDEGTALSQYGLGFYAGIAYNANEFLYYNGIGYTYGGSVRIHYENVPDGYDYHLESNDAGVTFTRIEGSSDYTMNCYHAKTKDITVSIVLDVLEWSGLGTVDEPYLIYNIDQMNLLATNVNGGNEYEGVYFKLMDDLNYGGDSTGGDVSYENYTTVGSSTTFQGIFDGNEKTISGIVIKQGNSNLSQGIFGYINGAKIKNLTLSNSYIRGQYYVGGIVGSAGYDNGATIENCRVVNTMIYGKERVGGIVGNAKADITNCHVGSDVQLHPHTYDEGREYFGGIVGYSNSSVIRGCTSGVSITKGSNDYSRMQYVGGILGGSNKDNVTTISYCLYLGENLEAQHGSGETEDYKGGIVGYTENIGRLVLTQNYYVKEGLGGVYTEDIEASYGAVHASVATVGVDFFEYGDYEEDLSSGDVKVYRNGLLYEGKFYTGKDILVNFNEGTGTEDDPYLISSTEEWEKIDQALKLGNSLSGKYMKQTADIDITTMSGSEETKPFDGIYDGDSKTLNVAIDNAEADFAAPFRFIGGATIKNLEVAGTVAGDLHSAGLVGAMLDETTNIIENCLVSTQVTSNDTHVGGIVGHARSTTATIAGCMFNGTLAAQTGTNTRGGAIVGWSVNGEHITVKDCFENYPTPDPWFASALNYGEGDHFGGTVINSYRKNDRGEDIDDSQFGYPIISKTEGIAVELDNLTEYSVSGIKAGNPAASNPGILFDGIVYAGEHETVKLKIYSIEPGLSLTNLVAESTLGVDIDDNIQHEELTADENGLYALTLQYDEKDKYQCEYHITGEFATSDWTDTGAGTEEDPYKIYTVAQLQKLSNDVNGGELFTGKHFQLMNDLTLEGTNTFTPIGYENKEFQGHFNGAGYTISGIIIEKNGASTEDQNIGLFGNLTRGGSVKNLTIANSRFVGYKMVGAIAGYVNYQATIENCHVGSDVEILANDGFDYNITLSNHGGIAGALQSNSQILGCTSGAQFKLPYNGSYLSYEGWGGIVGAMSESTVKDCVYYGNLKTQDHHGDFCGVIGVVSVSGTGYTIENNLYVKTDLVGAGLRLSNESTSSDVEGQAEWCEQLGVYAVPESFGSIVKTYGEDDECEGIIVYENGMVYDGMFFGQNDAEIAEVSYIDADGTEQTVNAYVLNGNETVLNQEWYVVLNDLTYEHELVLRKDVNLILGDGTTMKFVNPEQRVMKAIDGRLGLALNPSYDLTLYGQTGQTGTLSFDYEDDNVSVGVLVDDFVQNGGRVISQGIRYTIIAGDITPLEKMGSITINRGQFNAVDDQEVFTSGKLTINGGQVDIYKVSIEAYYEIGEEERILLGWTENEDYVKIDNICISEDVSETIERPDLIQIHAQRPFIDDDNTLHDGNEVFENPISIEGKKLIPAIIQLADAADNSDLLSTYYDRGLITVILKDRKLWKGEWNTFSLPFNLTKAEIEQQDRHPLQGADIRRLNSSTFREGTLTLDFTGDLLSNASDDEVVIQAGAAYIVKPAGEVNTYIENPEFKNVFLTARTIAESVYSQTTYTETDYVDFMPNFTPYEIAGEDKTMLYMGAADVLYYPDAAMTINSFRAYFKLKGGLTAGDLDENGVNAIVLNFDGESTAIQNINNGQWSMDNGQWYTIDGRKLNAQPTQKGLYIHGGKKVWVH